MSKYSVLLIEDDPMVCEINRQYIEKIDQFSVQAMASNMEEAFNQLEQYKETIKLVMIDDKLTDGVYAIPFVGIIKQKYPDVDVIVISANDSNQAIQKAYNLGAMDYVLKPFSYERLKQSLDNYRLKKERTIESMTQRQIDQQYQKEMTPIDKTTLPKLDKDKLEKGISYKTLHHIFQVITTYPSTFTINELTRDTNLSHVTVRHYVNYLVSDNRLAEEIVYQKNGRPYSVYHLKDKIKKS
ncbi:response regulator [Streptococcus pluranimalium]|uniref:response regulator n=1 Tax=Streptococcus pluranimalium TaxID=82348 RepID=UPI0039FC49FC